MNNLSIQYSWSKRRLREGRIKKDFHDKCWVIKWMLMSQRKKIFGREVNEFHFDLFRVKV